MPLVYLSCLKDKSKIAQVTVLSFSLEWCIDLRVDSCEVDNGERMTEIRHLQENEENLKWRALRSQFTTYNENCVISTDTVTSQGCYLELVIFVRMLAEMKSLTVWEPEHSGPLRLYQQIGSIVARWKKRTR